jgi:hypothetical protein
MLSVGRWTLNVCCFLLPAGCTASTPVNAPVQVQIGSSTQPATFNISVNVPPNAVNATFNMTINASHLLATSQPNKAR